MQKDWYRINDWKDTGYTENQSESVTLLADTADSASSTDPVGFALPDFTFLKRETGKDNWFFNSEITFKNDSFGWAMWVAGRRAASTANTINTSVFYSWVFLKKESSNWNIIGGYAWFDLGFTGGLNLHAKSPPVSGYSTDWFEDAKSLSHGTSLNKQYSGIWTKDDKGKGGVWIDRVIWRHQ